MPPKGHPAGEGIGQVCWTLPGTGQPVLTGAPDVAQECFLGMEKGGLGTVPWWECRLHAMAGRREGAPQW